jgi:uncharacterized cupredoxin-like copper-binding protein
MLRKTLVFSILLLIAGCAAASDELADSPVGYVPDFADRVAAVEWSEAQVVTVSLTEYAFSPTRLSFTAGRPYRLILSNDGKVTHFFVSGGFFRAIAARGLETPKGVIATPHLEAIAIEPGSMKVLEFVPVKPGKYGLECTVPLHATFGMLGTVEVI